MINRVGKMCVAAMSLCIIVLIVTRKRGDETTTFHGISNSKACYHFIEKAKIIIIGS
jgi:hypothetical protein